jgi:hypothetical protein
MDDDQNTALSSAPAPQLRVASANGRTQRPQRFDILRLGLGLDDDPWRDEPVTNAPLVRDVVFHDEARVRRLKSLGLTTPLHELEANKGQRGWEAHNLLELGLIGIDAIADRQELEGGATPDDIKVLLARYAHEQNPDTDSAAVAAAVLDALVKTRVLRYGEYRVPGAHVEHEWPFALIREVDEGRGVHLRATDPAINLLVGALDIDDLESVHAAAETLVAKLIERGRFDDARRAAMDARYRSIQYTERLRQLIADARNSIATVDLQGEVLAAIKDARQHISDRVEVESATLEQLRTAAERVSDGAPIEALRAVVNDCLRRHQRLHVHLQHAPEEFERLQVEQGFELGRGIGLPDPEPALLTPTLSLTAADALRVLDVFEAALVPPRPPVALDLGGFIGWLLRAKRTPPEPLGAAIEETEFAPDPDPDRFDPATRAAVEAMLADIDEPVTLSELLDAARDEHGRLAARLLAMRGLAAFAPEEQPDSDTVLLASRAGTLDDAEYAGDELSIERLRTAVDEPREVAS